MVRKDRINFIKIHNKQKIFIELKGTRLQAPGDRKKNLKQDVLYPLPYEEFPKFIASIIFAYYTNYYCKTIL
jgi:hypothetical protein